MAFLELEHRAGNDADLDEDDYILLGHENSEGAFSFQVTNFGKDIPSNSTTDREGFAGVEETTPSSYVALIQFDEPFVYSSSTWNSTDACHKNTSRYLREHLWFKVDTLFKHTSQVQLCGTLQIIYVGKLA